MLVLSAALLRLGAAQAGQLQVTKEGTVESPSATWLVFNNAYDGLFSDAKMSGVELLQREVRIATNGDVRLQPTPGQWDAAPRLLERRIDPDSRRVDAILSYPDFNFTYTVRLEPEREGVRLSVLCDTAVPVALQGRAGLNLEFLPPVFFRKSFAMDGRAGVFPLHPSSRMESGPDQRLQPVPMAIGRALVLAPEDAGLALEIEAESGELELFDGRDQAQNGWFVVRTKLPAGRSGTLASWYIRIPIDAEWRRTPVISYSQIGYHPRQQKVAIVELDPRAARGGTMALVRISPDGRRSVVREGVPDDRGAYLRYHYEAFDFSEVRESGLYCLRRGEVESGVFRIDERVFAEAWVPTLDVFLPVQMDHIAVKEGYRVWHGDAHADDARQAPVNHVHFDLYAQGPTTDSKYQPGEHVPGLAEGGWLDAGDFDLRTQTQYQLVQTLVSVWEDFRPERDQTTVDRVHRRVTLHTPDGKPDILQQIEHGVIALLAQHRVFGRAISGIVEPDLGQYTHLGDAASKTDGRIYDPSSSISDGTNGARSALPDDRWVFTSRSTALNYGSAAALAASSRALRGYNDALADECLRTAEGVWSEEHSHAPFVFQSGNTTGGKLLEEEFKAAVELFRSTSRAVYSEAVRALCAEVKSAFAGNALFALRVSPQMDEAFRSQLRRDALAFKAMPLPIEERNPFSVPITTGGWAGSAAVIRHATLHYHLHRAYPDEFPSSPVFDGLSYVLGRHPGSNLSLVSAVGMHSKEVAYGSNRADFSFIAGGIVPGVLILKPGFPENKEDWPFLWGENEYVVNLGGSYLYLVHAAAQLAEGQP